MGIAQHMMDLVTRAGYVIEEEKDLERAGAAYNCALQVVRQRRPAAREVGRNDPCPCGSGRKYKKCCLPRRAAATELSPEHIPNVQDPDAIQRDITTLLSLVRRLPELSDLRFDPDRAVAFLQDSSTGDPTDEQLDEIARRYAEHEDLPEDVHSMLLAAAGNPSLETAELRALAMGIMLAALEEISERPGPLSIIVYRATVLENLELTRVVMQAAERHGGRRSLLDRIRKGDFSLDDEERRLIDAAITPRLRKALEHAADRWHAETRESIIDGPFPVCLPLATMLPFLVEVEEAAEQEQFAGLFRRTCEIVPEDEALLTVHLDDWLSQADLENDEHASTVVSVRQHAEQGVLDAIVPALLSSTLLTNYYSLLEGEPAPDTLEQMRDPDFLEAHARFLDDIGYPALAERSRSLARRFRNAGSDPGT